MANDRINLLLPVGRLVQGSITEAQTTDTTGQPLVYKTGPKAGQPRSNIFFAVAIPKTPGVQHWCYETSANPAIGEWGMKLYQFGSQQWPNGQFQHPTFSWKIADGDDATPDMNGKRNCDKTGFAGHWILKFSGEIPPKTVSSDGTSQYPGDQITGGMYVQCYINAASNKNMQKPGLYLNHSIVSFQGYGEPIVSGPNPASVGFGGEQLPAGASLTPIGAAPAPVVPPMPGTAPAAGLPPMPGTAPAAGLPPMPGAAPAIPQPMASNVPPAPGSFTGALLGQPPAPAAPQMTPAAGGQPYEAFINAGWTEAMLIQHGMMLPR